MDDDELGPVLTTVGRWIRAIWRDHNTPAAVALMHPGALRAWPSQDIGERMRDRLPWLGDAEVAFSESWSAPSGSDLVLVQAEHDDHPPVRIVVALRLHPGTDEPEWPLVMDAIRMDEPPPGRASDA